MINRDRAFVIGSYVAGCIALADTCPEAGESVQADAFLLQPGGKGFNLLVGLHRLGISVDGILPVGSDIWGRMSPPLLEELGLPLGWLLPIEGASGGAVGIVDATGENRIAIAPGANALLSSAHIDQFKNSLATASIVAAQFEIPDAPLIHGFEIARSGGARTLLNPSPYRLITDYLLSLTDILVLNEREAILVASQMGVPCAPRKGTSGLQPLSHAVCRRGVDTLIITLGSRGVLAFEANGLETYHPAYHIDVKDTTGAGDAFSTGLIAALIRQQPLPLALSFAAACGALLAGATGVLDNLPTQKAVETFMAQSRATMGAAD